MPTCQDCGKQVPSSELQRRTRRVGSAAGSSANPLQLARYLFSGYYTRVSLCPDCANKLDAADRQMNRNILIMVGAGVGLLLLVGLLAVLLTS